ncbi:methylated-DNA--[protein]-cysteine S-methyltransferase [Paenibacillus oralis]|uniref:methylated-DNA--[protein]-cysteine S-methyltransferase n=1 Tax=Paenibacillus oralis TaxID=2490856 RepID=A0A3P3UBX8_9BACL|nr:methylated-DNA--[protein]-cysteine S-methyltransferase [Paenibacillus oralis]RRJ67865.1 methylated-DNA--[protein]-cysteine S-methyltransferase [Paenibacillus oralis]
MKTTQAQTLFWSQLTEQDWNLYICATEKGLAYVGSPNRPFDELTDWASRRFPGSPLVRDDRKLTPYAAELIEYFQGKRHSFTVPTDLQGTPFQLTVWQALCDIPFGQTCSYSDIAESIGKPSSVRAVGAAIGSNPLLVTVPCHRVIGKNGSLTGYRGGLEMKTRLLALEK